MCQASHAEAHFIFSFNHQAGMTIWRWILSGSHSVFLNIYLFSYLYNIYFGCAGSSLFFSSCSERGLPSSCGAQDSHCGGFPLCRTQALGHGALVAVAPGPWSTGLVAVAHRLSCSAACGIFPDQGGACVSCISRWIFIDCAPESPLVVFLKNNLNWLPI